MSVHHRQRLLVEYHVTLSLSEVYLIFIGVLNFFSCFMFLSLSYLESLFFLTGYLILNILEDTEHCLLDRTNEKQMKNDNNYSK